MKTAFTALRLCLLALFLAAFPAVAHAQVTAKPILHATVDTTQGNHGLLATGVFSDDLSTGQTTLGDPSRASTFLQRFQGGVWQITAADGLTVVNGNDKVLQMSAWGGTSDGKSFATHFRDSFQQLDGEIDVTGSTQAIGHLFLTDSTSDPSVTYVITVALKVDSSSTPAPGSPGGTLGG